MKTQDFEKELQLIDADLTITHSDKSPEGLSGVYYKGTFITGCPQHDVYEERNDSYGVEIMDRLIRHRTIQEIKDIVGGTLANIKNDSDYADAFFGRGEYSADKLK